MVKAAAALAALAVLLAGCGGTDTQVDEPAETESTVTAGSPSGLPPEYGVPAIADPLDPGRFATDPCALLAPEQRSDLGLPGTEQEELAGTVECLLHPPGDTVTTVQLQLMTDRGLADLVAQCRGANAPAACTTWAPTTVERYPAILDSGRQCRLMVGVAEQAVLLVNDVAEPKCRRVTEIAAAALTTLREEP